MFGDPGRARRKTPACNAAIAVRDKQAPVTDAENLQAALAGVKAEGGFMSAASPGVIGLFFRNDHYPSQEAYLEAIAEAMRHEYETVAKAGFVLQIDCPDLAMGRHIQYADLSLAEFRKRAGLHVEALNHAVANIPAEQLRIHVCWGNYEGPHHFDVALGRHHRHRVLGQARRDLVRGRQSAPRARMDAVRNGEAAGRQGADPRRDRIEVELHRASRADRAAHRPLRQAGRARERHRRLATAASAPGSGQAAVDPDVVFAKLKAMAEGAAIASKRFWN